MYKRETGLCWRRQDRAFIAEAPVPLAEWIPRLRRLYG